MSGVTNRASARAHLPVHTHSTQATTKTSSAEAATTTTPTTSSGQATTETGAGEKLKGADRAGKEAATGRLTHHPGAGALMNKLHQSVPTSLTPTDLSNTQQIKGDGTVPQTHVNVPFHSQFASGHGYTPGDEACFDAAASMVKAAGGSVTGSKSRIQIATGEDGVGRVTIDPQKAKDGIDYIDGQLAKGKPVCVGVSHADASYNADDLTDHFVVITGKGTDTNGKTFYTFNDPATGNTSLGSDTNPNNRFYVSDDGNLVRDGKLAQGPCTGRRYEMSMIRPNAE